MATDKPSSGASTEVLTNCLQLTWRGRVISFLNIQSNTIKKCLFILKHQFLLHRKRTAPPLLMFRKVMAVYFKNST